VPRRLLLLALLLAACGGDPYATGGAKVLRLPMDTDGPKSLDPVRGSTTYESQTCSLLYDTLLNYKYLVRPPTLEAAILEAMPDVSGDRKTYRFRLKRGIRFRNDPCFEGGQGREIVTEDVFYSWKRLADESISRSWWLIENTIVGLDEYKAVQEGSEGGFDYSAPVEGMRALGSHEFEVELTEPVHAFLYKLAMFQFSIVPREAVERYGSGFSRHPVGSGPFLLRDEEDWTPGKGMTLYKNPTYRDDFYPGEGEPGDREDGLLAAAGKRVPFVDRIEITFFRETQPKWLEFRVGHLDLTTTPAENFPDAFVKRTRKLRASYRKRGVRAYPVPLLDFIFRGFNMEDDLVGGYGETRRKLRQALHLATDLHEFNDAFYNGINVVFDGPIPVGLDGHPEGHRAPFSLQGPDIDRARKLLAEAGYPGGEGLPKIEYWVSSGGVSKEQSELMQRQLARVGVSLDVRLVDFSQLIEAVHNKKAPMFSFAWGSDYPDAENNLSLFYGPYASPGSNSFNYKRPEYDAMYERVRGMAPSPERTEIYETMRDMVIRDCPYIGSMGRIRYYLVQPWLRNCKPTETFWTWYKYLDVERER